MSMTDSDKKLIKDTWMQRHVKAIERTKKLKQEALERACIVTAFLKNTYGVEKVYLYGSLAKDDHFDAHSDIDLFIMGSNHVIDYWKMISKAQSLAVPFSLSIITDQEALPKLKEVIYMEGRLL